MQKVICFDPFELELEAQELRRGGATVKLAPQSFRLLVLLANHVGKLITRKKIRQHLWGQETTVVFEQGINRCIKEIRTALGDHAESPRYIETVPRRGYRFIAPIQIVHHGAARRAEVEQRQLTTNSPEAPIITAAISPDGKYLAYAEESGIYLRVIETGDVNPLHAPKALRARHISWFPDSTKLLASGLARAEDAPGAWVVSILGRAPRRLMDGAGEASVCSDGQRVAFISGNGKEIWTVSLSGGEPSRLLAGNEGEDFGGLAWFPDGKRLLFRRLRVGAYRFEISAECLDLTGGKAVTLIADPGLRGSCIAAGGRIIYSRAEAATRQADANLWEIRVNTEASTGRQITNWVGSNVYCLSATADGKRLAFLKGPYGADVFVGELEEKGTRLTNPRRLTLDDRNDLPTAWTPDSKAVLFHSDRNGRWEIFKQDLARRTAERILEGADEDSDDYRGARVSPDGVWVLYFARQRDRMWSWDEPLRLMRVPLGGGHSALVLSERRLYSVRCARGPANVSILGDREPNQMVFYALDPLQGRGREIARVEVNLPLDQSHWDISPDGSQIAVVLGSEREDSRIGVLDLAGRSAHNVIVKGWTGFQSLDWSANGRGWYISSRSAVGANLLYVVLRGHAHVLRQQPGSFQTWGIPSPNGRYLAFLEWTSGGNVWMLEDF